MSFGFGSGNTGSTFGGFGSTNNNNTTNTSGGSLFGGNTSTSGGFGASGATGGFGGGNTSNPFGQSQNKTTFGSPAPAAGGMFGNTGASTTGGFGGGATGGFGSTNNAASTGFGSTSTGGGLFGQSKPATGGFGSSTAAPSGGGGLFGSSNTGGFGATNTTTQNNPFGGSTTAASNPFGGGNTNTGFGASNTANSGSGFAFGGGNTAAAGNATQGTAATPFQPFTEKDGAGSSSTSAYQSITMQPQYQNKSFEELRVEDYMQNRKLPQSGSFGGTTGGSTFGGFGQTNAAAAPATGGGLFGGGNTNTTGGFGASNTATTGFGANANNNTSTGFGASNTGAGLFGAAKPATGGLFGNNAASSSTTTGGFGATSGSGGGLFGNTQQQANTGSTFGGGFGAGAANTNTTGGSLFGAQNNATQAKPAFGGFGASNTTSTGTGAFGQANNTQQTQGGGLFGGGNTANTGSSLFGGQQNKPAGGGLFGASTSGATNTGGGLFGNANNTNQQQQGTGFGQSTNNTGGGLFGANNNQTNNTGGGLFGNNQAKPATGGLFGASTTGNNTGGGLFGNNNQQQQQGANTGGSLFGNNNNQQQNAGGSLFGGQQNKPAGGGLFGASTGGGSLFGNSQAQNQGGLFGGNNANQGGGNSLFGGNNQNQNQGAGSSLFGNSQQQQQQNQLTATLTGDPYGNAQLFSSLAAPSPPIGPLATPLSGAKAPQRPRTSLLSSVRGGTPMLGASQNMSPRTRPGYGFSYSTYNSPASGSQNLTPGAAGLLRPTGSFGSSLSGRLSKSFSTSNLRGEAPEGHSLLRTPAAGQSSLLLGNGNGSIGSGRKLKIDRSLRTDLFGDNTPKQKQIEATKEQDHALRKRVSFDSSAEDNTAKPTASNSLVVREEDDVTPTGTPEPKQVNGNALDSVPEESATPKASVASSPRSRKIIEGGEYWTSPTIKQLQNMSRQQLQNIGTFTVGRHNLGQVEFGRANGVDLSTVPLERICGDLVLLEYRHCTVYGEDHDKPPVGEGLNVPSTIHLEQSWPRASRASSSTPQGQAAATKAIEKHRRGLANVKDTEFVDYDANTGIWTFKVEHFTTYGFDESDDEADFEDGTDMMDLQPKIPTSMRTDGHSETIKTQRSEESDDSDMDSPDLGEPEDTFEFKLSRRSHQDDLTVPGGFDVDSKSRSTFEHDVARTNTMHQDEHVMSGGLGNSYMDDPFIEAGGAVQAPDSGALQRYHSSSVMDDDDESDQEVPGSYRAEPLAPRSILKPSAHMQSFASPEKVTELPWEEQLQRTMSPKKRDRQALRDMQGSLARAPLNGEAMESPLKKSLFSRSQLGQSHLAVKSAKKNATGFGASTLGRDQDLGKSQAFTTGIDLINSLWGQTPKEPQAKDATAEMPYPSKRRRFSASNMNEDDAIFHDSFKPSFSGHNALVYSVPGSAPQLSGDMKEAIKPLVSQGRDIRFARFTALEDIDSQSLELQKHHTELQQRDDEQVEIPQALAPAGLSFARLSQAENGNSSLEAQEKAMWDLCSILFDPLDVCAADLINGMSDEQVAEYETRLRLDRFQIFWSRLVAAVVDTRIKLTRSIEEKAILLLTKGDIITACQLLMDAGDVKLATLVAQLPGSETSREVMKEQIKMWRERKDWSEFSDAHKALYCILAGETCTVAGLTGASEDRTQQFCLSERFGLDWRQSLALNMQFGGHENIVNAVSSYIGNLKDGKDKVKPISSDAAGDAENTLLGLLRLYALKEAQVERLFDPATVSGSALNSRLAWQLATVLEAKDLCDLPEDKMDALTLDFASQLELAGAWTKAAWILLHLSESGSRTKALQGLLERNAAQLPSPDLEQNDTLMEDESGWSLSSIAVPTSLIWEAKAVYAHAVLREPALQAKWLLYTRTEEAFAEAHDVLCSIVGPRAVIEKDYTDLEDLLACFDAHEAQEFSGWKHGGKIYADFVRLNGLTYKQKTGREGRNTCWVLRKGLEGAQQDELAGGATKSLEVRVAMGEIFRVLGEIEREIGVNPRFSFDEAMEVDGEVEAVGGKGLLDGYKKALGVVM